MRHFYRSQLTPADVLVMADQFFPELGLPQTATAVRARSYQGTLGALKLSVKAEGGHYTFIEAETDQMGESRLDRNVKKFFVQLHRAEDPSHTLEAAY
jgi:hypothetical protein